MLSVLHEHLALVALTVARAPHIIDEQNRAPVGIHVAYAHNKVRIRCARRHEQLRADFGLQPRMSGSGSACFALLADEAPVAAIKTAIRRAWGEGVFVIETRIA